MAKRVRTWLKTGRTGIKVLFLFVAGAMVTTLIGLAASDWYEDRKAPYVLSVERNPDRISIATGSAGDAMTYVIVGKSIGEIEPPPHDENSCSGRYAWAKDRYDAVDADSTPARITLEGRKEEQVQLFDVEVKRLEVKEAPRSGVHLACPGKGAQPDVRTLSVELDRRSPAVTATDTSGKPIPLLFTVKKGESEVFDLTAFTTDCDCEWEVILRLRHGQKVYEESLGPFRTASSLQVTTYHWADGDWVDIDGSASAAPVQLPNVDACALLTRDEASAFLSAPSGAPSGGTSDSNGASGVAVRISTCSFALDDPPPPGANPTGLVDSVTVFHEAAATPADGEREYEALLEGFRRQASGRSVDGFGDEATVFDGILVARRGNEIIQVQVSATHQALMRRVVELARTVVGRAWR